MTVSYGWGGLMFISVVCINRHIYKTTPRNRGENKSTFVHWNPCSSDITHRNFLIDFQAPQAVEPMWHIKHHIDLQLKDVKEPGKQWEVWFYFDGRMEPVVAESLRQMLAGRFWLCVPSLGLAFIHSPVTGWAAKWAPMWADSGSNLDVQKIVAGCKSGRHACAAMHPLHTSEHSQTWNETNASSERQRTMLKFSGTC